MDTIEIRPCPICNSRDIGMWNTGEEHSSGGECFKCRFNYSEYITTDLSRENSIRIWNRAYYNIPRDNGTVTRLGYSKNIIHPL